MADKFIVDPSEFLHIFLKNSEELINFLEHIHKVMQLEKLIKFCIYENFY